MAAGRASIVIDGHGRAPGSRFGWKAQVATLLTFRVHTRNEMGITNDIFPAEFAFGIPAEQMKHCARRPIRRQARPGHAAARASTTSPRS
jgi:CxxC motif-containing protein (DUF1111 family)